MNNWNEIKFENRLYLQDSGLSSCPGICHAFTTRLGGVSSGKIEGLNFGFRVGDQAESVKENYRLAAKDLGFSHNHMVLSKQTHTDNVRIVTAQDAGKGIVKESDIENTDGLITNLPNIPLVIFSADCVPLLLCDSKSGTIAAIHAGWRGSVKKIAQKAVKIMRESFGCYPSDILAAIGPSIGPCCFEVDDKTALLFPEEIRISKPNQKYHIDLWEYNRAQLHSAGIPDTNISIARQCTKCCPDKFYSYRAQKEHTGRMAAIIERKVD